MKFSWLGAVVALALAGVSPVAAQDRSAKVFVDEIYKAYVGKDAPAVDISSRAQLDKYFTPTLAKLIDDDAKAAEKNQDAPTLGGDPFIDAQDWEISDVNVSVLQATADSATATAAFKNFGGEMKVRLQLVKTPAGWRIDDIFWAEGSLRELYKAQ